MGRGPSIKTEIKKEKKKLISKAKTLWKLTEQKPLMVSAKEHIGKVIDNSKPMELLKFGAVISLTVIVKRIIEIDIDLLKEAEKYKFGVILPGVPNIGGVIYSALTRQPKPIEEITEKDFAEELWLWSLSFIVAYLIIDNFGSIMQATGQILSNIKGLVSALLIGGGTTA